MAASKLIRRSLQASAPLALMLAGAPAMAAIADGGLRAGTLEVPLNKSQVVTADRPIAKAMIGSADVADILPLTDRSVYVLGKKMGTTSLTLYDAGGRVLSVIDIAVGPDINAFQDQVGKLIPGSDIQAHISGSSMVLTGFAGDAMMVDRAMQLAKTYAGDNVVNLMALAGSQQVMLEVRFAEVKRQIGENIGVRGSATGSTFTGVSGPGASLTPGTNGQPVFSIGSVLNSFGVFGKAFSALGLDFNAYLDALEKKGYAKTLAEPTLVALSGEKASFLAGGEYPVPVAQSSNSGSLGAVTVEFKPFGVSLGFTPTVLGDHTINLKVEPEVSSIDPSASLVLNGISIPGLQTRRASTTLELRDGESFAIAGLLQQDFKSTVNQIPLLGNIPIIGALFRSTEFQKGETELLIVVTPHLVQPIRTDQVHMPTERVRDPDPAVTVMTGEAYDPVPATELGGQAPASQAPAGKAPVKGKDYEY